MLAGRAGGLKREGMLAHTAFLFLASWIVDDRAVSHYVAGRLSSVASVLLANVSALSLVVEIYIGFIVRSEYEHNSEKLLIIIELLKAMKTMLRCWMLLQVRKSERAFVKDRCRMRAVQSGGWVGVCCSCSNIDG